MINPTGFLTANGIIGQDLLRILVRDQNSSPELPTFNPARLQSGIANLPTTQIHVYNNVVFPDRRKDRAYPSQERGAGEGCSALTLQHFDCEVASSDLPPLHLRYFLGHDSLDGTAYYAQVSTRLLIKEHNGAHPQ
jgi:hypothetical protein